MNQRVAQRLLQKLAADVTIANNGAEALERIAEGAFDAVLMDCQMPVMDGFTATARIREAERQSGTRQATAHHRADRERHERGPRALPRRRHGCASRQAHRAEPARRLPEPLPRSDAKSLHDVDLKALHELTGGDAEFERELIETFVASGDKCLADIVEALRANDFETVGKRAHALKGASANIHAHRLSAAASHLESAARAKSLREIDGLVREVQQNLQRRQRAAAQGGLRPSRLSRARRAVAFASARHGISMPVVQLRPACLLAVQALVRRRA